MHLEDCGVVMWHLIIWRARCANFNGILGTMGPELKAGQFTPNKGSLYSVDSNSQVKLQMGSVTCSNGLAWNSDNTKVYYIDSGTREIHQYDFDLANGSISTFCIIFLFTRNVTHYIGR